MLGEQSFTPLSRVARRLLWALPLGLCGISTHAQSANTPLLLPSSVAYDSAGNLYFAEAGIHLVRRLTAAGNLTIVAGTGTQGFAGDNGPATAALLDSPTGLALDASGNLYIADTHNHRIRRLDAVTGNISTVADASLPIALAFSPSGALVYADAATHQIIAMDPATARTTVVAGDGLQGFSGDGGLATAAMLDTPSGLAFDAAGNLFFTDAHNHRVRRVDATTGIMTTVAGTGQPEFSGDGVPGTGAPLDLPRGLACDTSGNLFIADSRNQRIRRVDATTGVITTIAGDGTQAFLGDGSPAVSASLDTPRAITISPGALPTLADSANNRVRQVDSSQIIHTIAGVGAVSPGRSTSATLLMQASPATLTANVTAAVGTPTGTATLIDGTTPLASASLSSGAASFAMSILSAGSHTLTSAYSGNSALLPSTSPPLIVTIGSSASADFTLSVLGPATVTTPAGSAATYPFAVALTAAALNSPINLSVAGAPAGSTTSFNPALLPPLSGPATFTLTIDTPASARVVLPGSGRLRAALALVLLGLPFALRRRRRGVVLLSLLLLAGCGDRVSSTASAKPPLTYNLTISGTATDSTGVALLHTAQVTLIVN